MPGLGIEPILALEIGVHGGIRTHDPLLRSYTTGVLSINSEAKLLFPAYSYFSFKTLNFDPCL